MTMPLPDLTDEAKLLHIGKMTVLRKARRDAARKLRDRLIPLLNSIEGEGNSWDVSWLSGLVEEIEQINHKIDEIN